MQTTLEGQVWLQRVCRLNFCEMFEASSNLEPCVRACVRDFALPRFACWLSCRTHVSAECRVTAISDTANTLKRDQCCRARCVHGALYMTFGTTGCRTRTQVWQPHLLPSFSFMFSGVAKHRRDKGSYPFVLRPGKQARGCCGRLSFQI